jgi:integrase
MHGSRADAQRELARIIASTGTAQYVDPSKEAVAQFVERWLRDWAAVNVSNKTYTRYEQLLRKHLAARFGATLMQKFSAANLQSIYAAMANDGLVDRTRLHVHRVVHRMLGHAMRWGVVNANIADLVDAPRVKERELEVLTPDQVRTLLETLRGRPLYIIAAVLLGTGIRRGEILALRWRDVALDAGTLQVQQALEETKRGGLLFKAPKSRHGRRLVSLPPSTVTALREHRKTQQEQRMALGRGKIPADALVFPDWDGEARSPLTLTKAWRREMKAAGLRVTLHSLRHTHASSLIASGLDVLTISRRLGHATPGITLSCYGHLFKTDDRAAAIIENALTGAQE